MALIAVPRGLVVASEFLSVLLEDTLKSDDSETIRFERCIIPETISNEALLNITAIFKALPVLTPDAFLEGSVLDVSVSALPELLATSSFLQIQFTTDFLVQVLNYLAKIDDPRLSHLTGPINTFWIGDQEKLNTAAKVWLGLIQLPITDSQEDKSCFSSIKFLAGKEITITLMTRMTTNNTDERCADLLSELERMYCEQTFKPYMCDDLARLSAFRIRGGQKSDRYYDFYRLVDLWERLKYYQTLKSAGVYNVYN